VPEEPLARTDGGGESGAEPLPAPTPEGGLFGPAEASEAGEARGSERLDWISASAWAEAPWDERAEREAEEVELLAAAEAQAQAEDDEPEEPPEAHEEATTAPKVPAALPMRRRRPPQPPISSRGSGEWFYADPPSRQPLVSRGRGVTAPILLGVLGLLVVAIVVFLLATTLGGGDEGPLTAATSPTPAASLMTLPTAAPVVTPAPTAEPSPTAEPRRRFYRVKAGDTLSGIAARFDVKENHLACLNGITNKNIVVIGDRYEIPPEGFSCPRGWRNATPEP
jgi:LysM repeat protein